MHCPRGFHLSIFTDIPLPGKIYYEVFHLVNFGVLVAFKLSKRKKKASVACVGPTKGTADQFSYISIEEVSGQCFFLLRRLKE